MNSLNYIDLAVLLIVGISTIVAFFRGLITEVMSLVVWVVAFWGAAFFYQDVANILPGLLGDYGQDFFDTSSEGATEGLLLTALSYAITFFCILFLAGLVNLLISLLIRHLKIAWPDRLLGIVFGFIRGWLIVSFIGLFVVNTGLTDLPLWKNSTFSGSIEKSVSAISNLLPKDFLKQIDLNTLLNKSSTEA